MRSRYQFENGKGLYFITSTIIEFIPVFTSEEYFQIIANSLSYCRKEKDIEILAYVIMDNHFHLLIYSDGLSNKIKSIKRFTARQIINQSKEDNKDWLLNQFQYYKKKYKKKSKYQVWQEGVHPQLIQNIQMVKQKMEYIHLNPVRRGLIRKPEDWKYSSASNYIINKGVIEIDKINGF